MLVIRGWDLGTSHVSVQMLKPAEAGPAWGLVLLPDHTPQFPHPKTLTPYQHTDTDTVPIH